MQLYNGGIAFNATTVFNNYLSVRYYSVQNYVDEKYVTAGVTSLLIHSMAVFDGTDSLWSQ
jgi:hypothetical protein